MHFGNFINIQEAIFVLKEFRGIYVAKLFAYMFYDLGTKYYVY